MGILLDKNTRVLVQGITGKEGKFWTIHMKQLGTNIVSGVTPGKGNTEVEGIPVFNTVKEAVSKTEPEASVLFVPPLFTLDAVIEAIDNGLKLIVALADGIPLKDALIVREYAKRKGVTVIGGNTSGVISPGEAMLGFFPYWISRVYKPGAIGIMTRSGSLTNEIAAMVVKSGFGISTLVGVGGDAVPFTRFYEVLPLYQKDKDTEALVIVGELGGTMEEEVAESIESKKFNKPVVAFLAGRWAPKGKRMGHAGAIISYGIGDVKTKIEKLRKAGVFVALQPAEVGELLKNALKK